MKLIALASVCVAVFSCMGEGCFFACCGPPNTFPEGGACCDCKVELPVARKDSIPEHASLEELVIVLGIRTCVETESGKAIRWDFADGSSMTAFAETLEGEAQIAWVAKSE